MRTDFVLREVGTGLRRNVTMTVAMVLTTAISLLMVGVGLLAVKTIDATGAVYSDRLEIRVALTQDVSGADAGCAQPICSALRNTLQSTPGVQSVAYENQQQAYQRFQQLFAGQSVAQLATPQSLPATLRVTLVPQNGSTDAAAANVSRAMQNQVGVRQVIDQRAVVAKLFDFLGGVRNVTFALALVQAIAALMLISNTVQVSAYTRRTEVGVMRLVGATRWYTQLPFLVEAVITGVVGAVLAGIGLVVAKVGFIDTLLAGVAQNGVIPPVTMADVLTTAAYLVPIGGVVAGVTGYVTLRLYVKV